MAAPLKPVPTRHTIVAFLRAQRACAESAALLDQVRKVERGETCTMQPLPPSWRDSELDRRYAAIDGSIGRLIDPHTPPLPCFRG